MPDQGGAGAYSDLVARTPEGAVAGLEDQGVVTASAFRAYYTPLNEQHVRPYCLAMRGPPDLVIAMDSRGYLVAIHAVKCVCTSLVLAMSKSHNSFIISISLL